MVEWTPAAVERFWNRYADDPRNTDRYFAHQVGTGITTVLEQHVSRNALVVDYGCGPGHLAERLLERGFEVVGVDQSPVSRSAADRRCASFSRWRGAHAVAPSGDYDGVVCIETIEHLDDEALARTFSTIRDLLRSGGVGLFTTPNDEDLSQSMIYCPFCDTEFHAVQHVRSWNATSLRTCLSNEGFDVVRCEPTNLAWWQPLRSPWLGFRQAPQHIARRMTPRRRWGTGPHLVAVGALR